MNKKTLRIIAACAIVLIGIGLFLLSKPFGRGVGQAYSIGIIGGADGPTAIYVSGFVNWGKVCALLGGLAAALIAGIAMIRRCRKNPPLSGEKAAMKRLYNFLKILFFANIGSFLGRGLYDALWYRNHPELYMLTSAPWYTNILVSGIIALLIAATLGAALRILKKKLDRDI